MCMEQVSSIVPLDAMSPTILVRIGYTGLQTKDVLLVIFFINSLTWHRTHAATFKPTFFKKLLCCFLRLCSVAIKTCNNIIVCQISFDLFVFYNFVIFAILCKRVQMIDFEAILAMFKWSNVACTVITAMQASIVRFLGDPLGDLNAWRFRPTHAAF